MAKVPVLRSGWKIDPAELAVAQERTEARLSDLFSHRPATPARRGGSRPPIVVDGVELIGDTQEPLPLVDGEPTMSEPPGDTFAGAAEAAPAADLVGVVDAPGTDFVTVMVPPSSAHGMVGVMPWPGDEVERPEQLRLVDEPVGVPVMEPLAAPATLDEGSAWPLIRAAAAAEPVGEAIADAVGSSRQSRGPR